jgi:hypothetical protein
MLLHNDVSAAVEVNGGVECVDSDKVEVFVNSVSEDADGVDSFITTIALS